VNCRNGSDLRARTKAFALAVIRFVEILPKTQTAAIIGRQLIRSGASVGANYRAARRARSNADFIAKLGIVEEEIDECAYWLELLLESDTVSRERIAPLHTEADELTAIIVTAITSAKQHKANRP
jgi:four helix bundle protein